MKHFLPKRLRRGGLFLFALVLSSVVSAQVSGVVFKDLNANGTKEANEPGVRGATIRVYDNAGTEVGTANSDYSGAYSVSHAATGTVRVMFTPSGSCFSNALGDLQSGYAGGTYGTSVQFVGATSTNVNFAISIPDDYETNTNPKVFVPCYVNGDPLAGGSAGTDVAFVAFDFTAAGVPFGPPGPEVGLVTADKLGAVWGQAYSRQAGGSFLSAVVKRHVGLGPLGGGGIYLVNTTTGAVTQWLDLDAIGIATSDESGSYVPSVNPVGSVTVDFSPVIGSNTARGLSADKTIPNNDPAAFDQVGKLGLGGLEISGDGRYLFVVNLYDKKVYRLDVTDPANPIAPTAANAATKITSWSIPDPGCNNGVFRPWACKFYNGKVYIGGVCSGENGGGGADVISYVYALDPQAGFNTTPVLTMSMNYQLKWLSVASSNWSNWTNTHARDEYWSPRSPLLGDLEFDTEGGMILSWMDRGGLQGGNLNYPPSGTELVITSVAGDVLRAYPNTDCTTWTIENGGDPDGAAGPYTPTAAQINGSGPGGGEFFYDEQFDNFHLEVSQGAMAYLPSSNMTAMIGIDAIDYHSGGIFFLNNTTGVTDHRLGVFPNLNATGSPQYFGKAIGLGDLELVRETPVIEIGNRIWSDTDSDGKQDAQELGIDGLTVKLFEGTMEVASTQTANGGQYFFNSSNVTGGIKPNTNYEVRVETTQSTISNLLLSTADAAGNTCDLIDSDGTSVGTNAVKAFTTGTIGENNHSYDFGFKPIPLCVSPTLSSVGSDTATCVNGVLNVDAMVAVRGIVGMTKYAYSTTGSNGLFASTATASTADSIKLTGLASPPVSTTYTFRIWGTDTTCYNDTTVVLNPSACARVCARIDLSPNVLPSGRVGTPYNAQVSASGGVGPYQFVWLVGSTGVLPQGLSMTTGGLVNGTPTTVGSYAVKIVVRDINQCVDTLDPATITIQCDPIIVGSVNALQATCNGTTANNDVIISLASWTNATRVAYGTNGTTGLAYTSATVLTGGALTISGLPNPASSTIYTLRFFGSDSTCLKDTTVTVQPKTCTLTCIEPTVANVVPTPATCLGATPNNNAKIEITGLVNADKIAYSTNGVVGLTYATAQITVSGTAATIANLPNPATATTYLIRIFNGSESCFVDRIVTIQATICNCPPVICPPVTVRRN